jgi:TonB family protein
MEYCQRIPEKSGRRTSLPPRQQSRPTTMSLVPGQPLNNDYSSMDLRHRVLSLLTLVPLLPFAPAVAQQILYVEQVGQFVPVVAMADTAPQIADAGNLETVLRPGNGFVYALGRAKAYVPYFITVRSLQCVPQSMAFDPNGVLVDRALAITADLESAYPLKNVFLALEVKGKGKPFSALIAHEVGGLKPGIPVSVHFLVPFDASWDECEATLHLFTGGPEVLHSKMPPAQVDHELDLMVQEGIKGVMNAPPQRFIGPPPEYPAALAGKNVSGSATIALGISATGAVLNAVVREATLPEFGESALKAVRQWRFLPKVQDGKPVESKVVLPLIFKPPPPEAKE